ncbi:APC membrane recruitment protein 2 [Malaclemys terrapin pileata]|uniref:APC membrane recruitment protein 2 n=1 Tax=Malaclemys terrapin pileata TaxID=2991368 RepID=UPI0023A8F8A9|nr:APC membrane recruitment protein 2 [Malaclemys terrapin pileata]
MDLHCDCAETPAVEPPSGKINKTAFKLFKRRKSGGTMPSIFGVKNKGGDGKGSSKAGMVRSKTHDGLADVVLESSKKEESSLGGGGGVDQLNRDINTRTVAGLNVSSNSSVAKSHSFFSLLKKNGKSENGKGENADQRAGSRQKKGLKGIFSSMRWHKKDKNGKEERGETSEIQSSLIMSGSLTASLECIKEEAPKPLSEPQYATEEINIELSSDKHSGDVHATAEEPEVRDAGEMQNNKSIQGEDPAAAGNQHEENRPELPDPCVEEVGTAKDTAITGCGDIIADQEDEVGSSSGGCEKSTPGASKPGTSKKNPNMVAYQGGGEEMASPDQVDDTYLQEFWDMLSQTEEQVQETQGGEGGGTKPPEIKKETKCVEGAQDGSMVKRIGLNQIPIHLNHKEDQKNREYEQPEGIPNSDEGYWDSTTPGPEEDSSNSVQKESIPRDSYSGDALYDLYADTDENITGVPSDEEVTCVSRSKPVSPVTTTCSLKTPAGSVKDSKIPISIKHLTSLPTSHGTDASNSHHIAHHHPTKSEIPRTKIPVSKVLVRRVSNRGLAGTMIKATTFQDNAKK